jgi:Lar family restriction alleviation protein
VAGKIKPCPFCGRDDLVPSFHTERSEDETFCVCIACEECGAEGPPVPVNKMDRSASLDAAHKLWNARV